MRGNLSPSREPRLPEVLLCLLALLTGFIESELPFREQCPTALPWGEYCICSLCGQDWEGTGLMEGSRLLPLLDLIPLSLGTILTLSRLSYSGFFFDLLFFLILDQSNSIIFFLTSSIFLVYS